VEYEKRNLMDTQHNTLLAVR